MFNLFVVCIPGLEQALSLELKQQGITVPDKNISTGGIEIEASLEDVFRLNYQLRTASDVLVRLGKFEAESFDAMVRGVRSLAWALYLKPGSPVHVRVTAHKSRLYHTGAIAERVGEGIAARLGTPSPLLKGDEAQQPDVPQIIIRNQENEVTVSISSAGEPLHRRGYRLATAKAPLKESLAAGLLILAGWKGTVPLMDPFCGAGTIAIEAALMAKGIAPGANRHFAFESWPLLDSKIWAEIRKQGTATTGYRIPPIFASDRDAGAIEAAKGNAERAGVADLITFTCQAFSCLTPPPGTGWIITNPPYGVRVSHKNDLRNLYVQLGLILRERCEDWKIGILTRSASQARQTGLTLKKRAEIDNGGLRTRFLRGKVWKSKEKI
ncbi:class I SAM-dependent RNA methyltransferase [bacterium]|nr:class I SAM-dependent RNA methyltransferase [bacterium]